MGNKVRASHDGDELSITYASVGSIFRNVPTIRIILLSIIVVFIVGYGSFRLLVTESKSVPQRLARSHMMNIGSSLKIYAYKNEGQFPSNLEQLYHELYIEKISLSIDPEKTCDLWYTKGLSEQSPTHWILAFLDLVQTERGGNKTFILLVSGDVRIVPSDEFKPLLDSFRMEYEKQCGEPPMIIPPH